MKLTGFAVVSLIAYDQRVNRFGIGVAPNDYLMRNDP